MNVLLINHYAGGPDYGMEFRPHLLAREWVRQGHRVLVLGAGYSHLRSKQPLAPHGRVPREEIVDGVHFRWYPAPAYTGNGLGRALNIAAFLARVWWDSKRLLADFRPDAIIASSTYPMDFWLARHLARKVGAVLAFELHDLWPASLVELSGMSPGHPFARLCALAEQAACQDCDAYISLLPAVAPHVTRLGLDPAKLCLIPNGISAGDWVAPAPALRDDLRALMEQARAAGDAVVGYAGSMGLPNALDNLLDAAALLRDAPVQFVLVGDGHERERLARRIREEKLDRVHWRPPVPKAMIPSLLAACEINFLGFRREPLYRFGIAPNKLMDYMMSARPVLMAVEAGNDPVAEAGCGITVAPESPAALAAGLQQLLALPVEERQRMGEAGRAHVLAHHEWSVLAGRFMAALEGARGRAA